MHVTLHVYCHVQLHFEGSTKCFRVCVLLGSGLLLGFTTSSRKLPNDIYTFCYTYIHTVHVFGVVPPAVCGFSVVFDMVTCLLAPVYGEIVINGSYHIVPAALSTHMVCARSLASVWHCFTLCCGALSNLSFVVSVRGCM